MANEFVAYQDERHGLGAWVAEQIAASLFKHGQWVDEQGHPVLDADGKPAAGRDLPKVAEGRSMAASYGMSLHAAGTAENTVSFESPEPSTDKKLDYKFRTWTSPRGSADATFSAVISQRARVGVVPLYDNDQVLNRDTIGALIDFPQNRIVREYVAKSNYVLAVPSDLVHEIEQSGFTDSFAPTGSSASFGDWTRQKQDRYLRRVNVIYASAEAASHCATSLDGYRARGIEVQILPEGADAYREGLGIAHSLLDPDRQVETHFSANEHKRVSKAKGGNRSKPVVAVLLSGDLASKPGENRHDKDYFVLETEMAGADSINTSFVALTRGPASSFPVPLPGPLAVMNPKRFADSEMRAIETHFRGQKVSDDALGRSVKPRLVRCVYCFDTVGKGAKDYPRLLRYLREDGFSFQTTTLDDRPGHPMAISVDVPIERYKHLNRFLGAFVKMKNPTRLADFQAFGPMVQEAHNQTHYGRRLAIGFGLIGVALAFYLAWQMNPNGF